MKTNLYVLYGGKSAEHEVSLQTAFTIFNALDQKKFNVYPIYITEYGVWCSMGKLEQKLTNVSALQIACKSTTAAESMGDILLRTISGEDNSVVFPVIHGTNGEDGTLQGLLELLNVPYVGNGVLSSAAGMDKVIMKHIFAKAGIPQVAYLSFFEHEWAKSTTAICDRIEGTIGYPCYVKPANLGSSIGINRCTNRGTLARAIEEAFTYDRKLIVEQEAAGREIQLAVMGNDHPVCSIAGEFVREPSFFDYDKKYKSGPLMQRIPAQLSEETYARIREWALLAFKALDGSGLMRVDFFVTENNEIYLNEVNTLPGFTPISMFPVLWEKTDGTTYPQLIEKLISLAVERHERKQNIRYVRLEA